DLMKKMIAVIAVLTGALLTGACADQRDEPAEAFAPTAEQPAKPVRLQWGQPATVSGTNGSKLKVTPIGVLYDKGSPDIEPENGVFGVIALRAAAVDQRETIEATIDGGGRQWQGADRAKLKGTPMGVLYDEGSPAIEPENGVFVVIALRAEAVDQPETIAAPITGGGFMWQGADAQKISGTEGNAVITPWVGSVNE